MFDIECFSYVNHALEAELSPIMIMASNCSHARIRETIYNFSYRLSLNFLNCVIAVSTQSYSADEIRQILII